MKLGVSYIATHLPHHIETDMAHLAEIGCQEVLFAIQENHFYNLDGALRFGPAMARKYNLTPYAVFWGLLNTFGGGRNSQFMLNHPELWRITRDGSRVPMACQNNPGTADYFLDLTAKAIAHGFAGVFIDEPTAQECTCPYCRERFQRIFGSETPEIRPEAPEWRQYELDTITEYVTSVCTRVKEFDAAVRTMTCLMPHDRDALTRVAHIPTLDVLGVDPYWMLTGTTVDEACEIASWIAALCRQTGKESQVWLQGWQVQQGREAEMAEGGRRLAEQRCDSFYTWSYRGGLGTTEECADAYATWERVCQLYRELSGKTGNGCTK